MTSSRLPRDLHPVAWWVWALGLATAASFTTNPLMLLTIDGVAVLVVMARRPEQPWADAFKVYVMVAVVIVVMRVLFRVLLGGGADGGLVLVDLPEVPLPDWVLGLHLLGPVTRESRARRACTTGCGSAPSWSASVRPTRWPTPSGCSARCRRRCTRSARHSSWR